VSCQRQKRQIALSREVIENKGLKDVILNYQSRELIENKGSYKKSYKRETGMTLRLARIAVTSGE
jgi:hypothetical protein